MIDSDLTETDSFPFRTTVTLRYSDQDPMNHINNVAITALLESGRSGLLMHMFGTSKRWSRSFVLAHLDIDYHHELLFPGSVDVLGRLLKIGQRSITTGYAIVQGDTLCVTSKSINVGFDPDTRRSAALPDELVALLRPHCMVQADP